MAHQAKKQQQKKTTAKPAAEKEIRVSLRLSAGHIKRLNWIHAAHLHGPVQLADASKIVFDMALLHLQHTSRALDAFCKWRDNEGFDRHTTLQMIEQILLTKI